jgi:NIPSNAP
MKGRLVTLWALTFGFLVLAGYVSKGDEKVDSRIFELRTYTCASGKMEALQARFRDDTLKLFEKHHMTVIGFWSPTDREQAQQKLIYLLAFPSQDAAAKSWKDFQADPDWQSVKMASEKDGKLVEKIESVYLKATDYSLLK